MPRQPDPLARLRAESRVDLVEDAGRELGEDGLGRQLVEGARALRQEDVGRRVVALLLDPFGEIGRLAVAHVDPPPRLLHVPLEEGVQDAPGAAGVDREAIVTAATARREHEGQEGQGDQRAASGHAALNLPVRHRRARAGCYQRG